MARILLQLVLNLMPDQHAWFLCDSCCYECSFVWGDVSRTSTQSAQDQLKAASQEPERWLCPVEPYWVVILSVESQAPHVPAFQCFSHIFTQRPVYNENILFLCSVHTLLDRCYYIDSCINVTIHNTDFNKNLEFNRVCRKTQRVTQKQYLH